MCVTRRAARENTTRWPPGGWRGPRWGSRTCRSRASMASSGRSGCWSTIVKTSSLRTRIIARLRWRLHELDPGWTEPAKLERHSAFDKVKAHLSDHNDGAMVRRLALRLVEHLRLLTAEVDELT